MCRPSSYTVVSDSLTGGGFALLNAITGAIDLVDAELGESFLSAAIREPSGALVVKPELLSSDMSFLTAELRRHFLERGHLTCLSVAEERALVQKIAEGIHEAILSQPVFMIVPDFGCNYRCTYCFERPLQTKLNSVTSEISHRGPTTVMTARHVEAIYRSTRLIQRRTGPAVRDIVLYGGEPLDARNSDLVHFIVQQGADEGFFFAAVTNGHDLDSFLNLLGKGGIRQIQISIDGPKEVHDRRRIHLGRESSFDKVVMNVGQVLRETDVEVQIRVHVDLYNIELFGETLRLFSQEGWLDHPRVVVYASTVYEKSEEGLVSSQIRNREILRKIREVARQHLNVYTSPPAVHAGRLLDEAFRTQSRVQAKATFCAANSGNYIFAPDGKIYSCWESIGKACSRIGDYLSGDEPLFDREATTRWFSRSVARIPQCLSCSHALLCGGGCAQYAEYNHGEMCAPFCDDFQAVFARTLADHIETRYSEVVGFVTLGNKEV